MAKNRDKKPEATKEVPEKTSEPVDSSEFITKKELNETLDTKLEAFLERMSGQMAIMKDSKFVHADDGKLGTAGPIHGGEMRTGHGDIEPVSEQDFAKTAELEAFMEQELIININISQNKEANPVVVPNVNGVNMPICRGVDSKVKRKYVEALARCTHTRYEQVVPDSAHPDKFLMVPNTALVDMFIVKHDPHKFGAEWLDSILKSAA